MPFDKIENARRQAAVVRRHIDGFVASRRGVIDRMGARQCRPEQDDVIQEALEAAIFAVGWKPPVRRITIVVPTKLEAGTVGSGRMRDIVPNARNAADKQLADKRIDTDPADCQAPHASGLASNSHEASTRRPSSDLSSVGRPVHRPRPIAKF